MRINAIILAGGKIEDDLALCTGERAKAFIKLNSKCMVEYTIDALRDSSLIKEIILVSDLNITPESVKNKVDKCAESGNSMIETLLNGIESSGASGGLLVLPCDMPLVTKDTVEEFLNAVADLKVRPTGRLQKIEPVQIAYGIVEKQNYVKKFPKMKRTYLRLKEGTFCGTGFFYLSADVVKNLKDAFEEITRLRKKPWKLIQTLGFGTIVKFLLGRLSVKDLEKRAEKLFNCAVRAVMLTSPEAAVNIDKVSDLKEIIGTGLQNLHNCRPKGLPYD